MLYILMIDLREVNPTIILAVEAKGISQGAFSQLSMLMYDGLSFPSESLRQLKTPSVAKARAGTRAKTMMYLNIFGDLLKDLFSSITC